MVQSLGYSRNNKCVNLSIEGDKYIVSYADMRIDFYSTIIYTKLEEALKWYNYRKMILMYGV